MPSLTEENKNYQELINAAEGAYLKRDYLEAFLIQSCVIEGVIKNYASAKLTIEINRSPALKEKFKNFELARLTDDLLLAGKISSRLYEDLSNYRKKRNDVIHRLLEYTDKDELEKSLKEAYESGKQMKGLIVDDMTKESPSGDTLAELEAELKKLMTEIESVQPGFWERMRNFLP